MTKTVLVLLVVWFVSWTAVGAVAAVGKGAAALLTPEMAGKLHLTDAQKQQIQALVRTTAKKFSDTQAARKGQPGLKDELEKIRQEGQDQALAILSGEQKAAWAQLAAPTAPSGGEDEIAARSLIIPTIAELKNPPSREAFGPTANLLPTHSRPPRGEAYVILTDQTDPKAVAALQRLVEFRHGTIVNTPSLGELYQTPAEYARLQQELRKLAPRYVAIAPRPESYRENMHLCILKLLSSLETPSGLSVFPGYLVAEDASKLSEFIDRTIAFKSFTRAQINPVSIGTIEDDGVTRYRSYQKAKIIQKMFAEQGKNSPAVFIVTNPDLVAREDFPKLGATPDEIAMLPGNRRQHYASLSDPVKQAMTGRNVLFMFGHGLPERLCGTRVSAFASLDFSNELVFCGSCMSASPLHADRVNLENQATTRRFGTQAVDNGAVMVLGHMGLCGGFPEVYPMADHVFSGLSVGEAYQRVMNGLIGKKPLPDYYVSPMAGKSAGNDPANNLLLMLWADPALVPIKP